MAHPAEMVASTGANRLAKEPQSSKKKNPIISVRLTWRHTKADISQLRGKIKFDSWRVDNTKVTIWLCVCAPLWMI